MRNPHYINKPFLCVDKRQLYVPVPCGNCYECRRQKAQGWRVRLAEEMKVRPYSYFVTLTFSEESLNKFKQPNEDDKNQIAIEAMRLFLERWRKKYKKSLRHWMITELGHTGTERIHLHGIIFPNEPITAELLKKIWSYGRIDIGQYCNMQTINYIVKYVTKIDTDHPDYKSVIITSPGMGASFLKTYNASTYVYKKDGTTKKYYTLPDGHKIALPTYYYKKLYSDIERLKLWSELLDKDERYINGIQIKNFSQNWQTYIDVLTEQQRWNKEIGYGSTENEWKERVYNETCKRISNANSSLRATLDSTPFPEEITPEEEKIVPNYVQLITSEEDTPF